ncbi:Glutamine transport ATP-binding protein GlnQ [Bacillus sp. THAF10]|uniref:AAA family ATPase n=1 Tax=Bacillus sp. THAF10 TaxID=2587848 RepID=UPI0012684594|nr:AAA family ATPase [Bacillus sp. THAF10]QFT90813.1 Glutamine transport ATP-binding protein GlnQ [Bacillus sp. THAF10]
MSLISSFQKDKDLNDFSGGERQLISIATGIASTPEMLIVDESFSNLDSNRINEVMETLKRISSYITIIIVTHDQSIIEKADRVVNLSEETLMCIS